MFSKNTFLTSHRPRERLKSLGPDVLSDAELLAIILQKGHKEENVIDMSKGLGYSKQSEYIFSPRSFQ